MNTTTGPKNTVLEDDNGSNLAELLEDATPDTGNDTNVGNADELQKDSDLFEELLEEAVNSGEEEGDEGGCEEEISIGDDGDNLDGE